jgi:hypothetical protein
LARGCMRKTPVPLPKRLLEFAPRRFQLFDLLIDAIQNVLTRSPHLPARRTARLTSAQEPGYLLEGKPKSKRRPHESHLLDCGV